MKTFAIYVTNNAGQYLGYWLGANTINPNDSISGKNGNPVEWGNEDECNAEIEKAATFCKAQRWDVNFQLEGWGE